MMVLPSEFIIRSWKNIGMMLCDTKNGGMKRLGLLEFLALKKEGGLTDYQQHRAYPNEYFPIVQWAITNRCNYKCRHCFMMPGDKNSTEYPVRFGRRAFASLQSVHEHRRRA